MIVYAESSAVLSWLLGEPAGSEVQKTLEQAEFVVTSDLTLVECDRAFHRAHTLGELSTANFVELREELCRLALGWIVLRLSDSIIERARDSFPEEPIRSLDALHLASALHIRGSNPEIALLTYDGRVRRCANTLGMRVLPETTN